MWLRTRKAAGHKPVNSGTIRKRALSKERNIYLAEVSLLAGLVAISVAAAALARPGPSAPPAVGMVDATRRPITETSEFLGRIEAISRVNVAARVTAFLKERLFNEGAFLISRETSGRASTVFADRSATLPKSPVSRHQLTSSCFFRYQSAD